MIPTHVYKEVYNQAVVSIDDAKGGAGIDLTVQINPVQAGNGDPSPTNVRSISGWAGANIYLSATDADDPDKQTFSITFPQSAGTVYGGTLTINKDGTGTLVVDYAKRIIDNNISFTNRVSNQNRVWYIVDDMPSNYKGLNDSLALCDKLPKGNTSSHGASSASITIGHNSNYVYLNGVTHIADSITNFSTLLSWLQDNPITYTYKLAEPQTYQLTALQVIETLQGINNLYADTGNINYLKYEADDSVYYDAIKNGNPTHMRMTFSGQSIVLDDQDIYHSTGVCLNDILNGNADLVMGKAVSKQVTTTFINSSRLDGLKWASEFTLEFGVEIGSPAVTYWVQVGVFSGEKPNNITSVDTIEFTAYDRMKLFDAIADEYIKSISYPATVQDIYDGLCAWVGVQNDAGDELPDIMSRSYASAPAEMTGYTYRDILAWIAEACGCYAKINASGHVQMVWFTDNTAHAVTGTEEFRVESGDINDGMTWDEADQLTWDEMDELTWNDVSGYQETYRIDSVMVKQLNNDLAVSYPYTIDGNVYLISDNPFLSVGSYADVTAYIVPIYNRIYNFGGYLPVRVECIGNWCVEAGDIITLDVNEHTVTFPIFVKEMRWNGSVNDSYETTANKQRPLYSNDATRQRNMTSKKIEMFVEAATDGIAEEVEQNVEQTVEQNYYKKRSGILIEPEGVDISGNKYVKVSGGNGFHWTFDEKGLSYYDNDDEVNNLALLQLGGRLNTQSIHTKAGIYEYYNNEPDYGKLALVATDLQSNLYDFFYTKIIHYGIYNFISFLAYGHGAIGSADHPIERIYGYEYYGILNSSNNGIMNFHPKPGMANGIRFMSSSGQKIDSINGSSDPLTLTGNVQGYSSREIKKNIVPLGDFGETIDALEPVSFVYKKDKTKQKHFGLIYEDTIDILGDICRDDPNDDSPESKSIAYIELIPILLNEIKNLRKRVAELEKKVGE